VEWLEVKALSSSPNTGKKKMELLYVYVFVVTKRTKKQTKKALARTS
jgi:hypothetical protein